MPREGRAKASAPTYGLASETLVGDRMIKSSSEKAPGYNIKTPKKRNGRKAKRMAFYASNRSNSAARAALSEIIRLTKVIGQEL